MNWLTTTISKQRNIKLQFINDYVMPTSFELLQELDMVMREFQPLLAKQDADGNFMHRGIELDIPEETVVHLIKQLKSQLPSA